MVSQRVHSSDVYRLFLQAAMSRRIMNEAVAKALWKACYEAIARADPTKDVQFVGGSTQWGEFLNKIQRMLDPLDLEFARSKDEETGKIMYAITNTKGDEVAQLASDYSPAEIAFFKAVVEQIMLSVRHAYSVSSILALREASHLKSFQMTKSQAEVILTSLVARGWLVKSKRGRYSLGTRSILELSNYLKNTYDETDLLECVVCMELVTKGYMCPTANCNAPLHKHCYSHVRRRNLCPKCQQEWGEDQSELIPIGEDAIKDDKQEKRRVRRSNGADEEEEPEDESQETSQAYQAQTQTQTQSQSQSQSQTQTQTQRKASKSGKSKKNTQTKTNGRIKKRAVTPDSVEEEDEFDDMYDDDEPKNDAIDIDNLAEIREQPSARNRRR
ncbi:hypothetical protein ACEPAI_5112 [Sanghuangporus weigelae]